MGNLRVNKDIPEKRLVFGNAAKAQKTFKPLEKKDPPKAEVGVCEHEGKRFYASRVPGNNYLTLCVPTDKGILIKTDSQIIPTGEVKFHSIMGDVAVEEGRVESFESRPTIEVDREKMTTIREDKGKGRIIDYLDVTVNGIASEFGEDRDGETVMPGAFSRTLADFRRNPVMLIDHVNSVKNIVGSYNRIREADDGLQVSGKLSNSPEVRGTRFLVAENHLKGFSIGGLMKFNPSNFKEIEEVKLFEISLVAVPANPRTLFQGRSLDLDTAKKAFKCL